MQPVMRLFWKSNVWVVGAAQEDSGCIFGLRPDGIWGLPGKNGQVCCLQTPFSLYAVISALGVLDLS